MPKKLKLEGGQFKRDSKEEADTVNAAFCVERASTVLDEAVRTPQQANLVPAAELWVRLAELLTTPPAK